MKKKPLRVRTRRKWYWTLLFQILATLAVFLILSLSLWLGKPIHSVCLWFFTPAAGFISACIATRSGLLNYLAWLIPPMNQIAVDLLLWGYAPSVASVFLCAFVSLVGAATGEVLKRSHDTHDK